MEIAKDIFYAGVNDRELDLFEGQYDVPNGMAYNSYVVTDDKIAVFDSVERRFGKQWLANLAEILGDRQPDYLIIQHMEPDHSANIQTFIEAYPDAVLVGNAKTFSILDQFYSVSAGSARLTVKDRDTLDLGEHKLTFIFAPMVHWPEVMVTYDSATGTLFSADAFGKFGALDADEDWDCEARRYYFGIVGKYGAQVRKLLAAVAELDVKAICPLHGPALTENIEHYVGQYDTWSSYRAESRGVFIAYASIYGNTKQAAEILAEKLRAKGCPKVAISDLAREDMAECVEDAFRYDTLVLASVTYNAGVMPCMGEFINHLTEKNYQNRRVGFIENGTWAPAAKRAMLAMLEKSKNLEYFENSVTVKSALNEDSEAALEALAEEICK